MALLLSISFLINYNSHLPDQTRERRNSNEINHSYMLTISFSTWASISSTPLTSSGRTSGTGSSYRCSNAFSITAGFDYSLDMGAGNWGFLMFC